METTRDGEASQPRTSRSDDKKPPYAPFPTFKNFVEKLKDTGIPHRIDKSVMGNLSGAAQSQVLGGLRFLDLTDLGGNPTNRLHELVESFGTPLWATSLHGVLKNAYALIVDGLDLHKASPAQLTEAFRDRGKTDGSLTEKAIRFYLKALEDAGFKCSPHFARNPSVRAPSRRRKTGDQAESKNEGPGIASTATEGKDVIPKGMIAFPIHLPGKPAGTIVVPDDIEEDEVAMVDAQIAVLRLYAKRMAGKAK